MATTRDNAVARILFGISLALLLEGIGAAQEIGVVDLTRGTHQDLPYGCKQLLRTGPIGDGWRQPQDEVPLSIGVELVQTEEAKLVLGATVRARARLQNNDTRSITIPWSAEFKAIEIDQHLDALRWEEGTFEFELKDQQGHRVALKSLTGSLYGSESSRDSERTLNPGESISALVKFKLESEFGIPVRQLTAGEWQLSATWTQTGIARSIGKDCGAAYFYSHYDHFYRQETPSKAIQILDPAADRMPAK
jgi:hypothetical protein